MAQLSFEVSYDGPAVQKGRIPARELAPSLLSLADLFATAGLVLYPENEPARLDVVATREGSFDLQLLLHGAGMAWDQVQSHPLETAGALALLKQFVLGDSVDLSLFALIKKLKGRSIEREEQSTEQGMVDLTVGDERLRTLTEVALLNRLPPVRRDARTVVGPLKQKGIDEIRFRSDGRTSVDLSKGDITSFDVPSEELDEVLSEQEIDAYLQVLSPRFEGDRWRFGGMGERFTAPIKDQEFLRRVKRHEEVFGAGDQLHVSLKLTQKRNPVSGVLRSTKEIVHVHETVPAPQQLPLERGSDDDDASGSLPISA